MAVRWSFGGQVVIWWSGGHLVVRWSFGGQVVIWLSGGHLVAGWSGEGFGLRNFFRPFENLAKKLLRSSKDDTIKALIIEPDDNFFCNFFFCP
jgi:hypothetical protein